MRFAIVVTALAVFVHVHAFAQRRSVEVSAGPTASWLYQKQSRNESSFNRQNTHRISGTAVRMGLQLGLRYRQQVSEKIGVSVGLQYNYSRHPLVRSSEFKVFESTFVNDTACANEGYTALYQGPTDVYLHLLYIPLRVDIRPNPSTRFLVGVSAGRNLESTAFWQYDITGTTQNNQGCTMPASGSDSQNWHMNIFYTEAAVQAGYGFKTHGEKRLWIDVGLARSISSFEDLAPRFGVYTTSLTANYEL